MATDSQTHHGIVHGRTIALDRETGLPDGQEVTIILQPGRKAKRLPPGEGIRRSAGGWSDDPEGLDSYLKWSLQQRKIARPEIEP